METNHQAESNTVKKVEKKPEPTEKSRLFILSSSPHATKGLNVPKIMWSVVLALVPAVIFAVYNFGFHILLTITVSILVALLTETAINKIRKRPFTIGDGSAVITGLLLAMTLPPSFPLGFTAMGAIFGIAIGKQIFGGLGYNIFNPALLGRAFLQASFPVYMTTWTNPKTIDAISSATPLGIIKFGGERTFDYFDLFVGNVGGCIGETSALAILAGGIYLLVKKYADWRIPVSYLSTVFLLGGLFWLINPHQYPDPVFHLLAGGLMLGAFFMATDMVTSPVTPKGAWIFGCGAGIILIVIRLFGGLPEGVMYSILLMNSVTPLINRYTRPKFFGEVKHA
jgi:electron transport complex protein RnfD